MRYTLMLNYITNHMQNSKIFKTIQGCVLYKCENSGQNRRDLEDTETGLRC